MLIKAGGRIRPGDGVAKLVANATRLLFSATGKDEINSIDDLCYLKKALLIDGGNGMIISRCVILPTDVAAERTLRFRRTAEEILASGYCFSGQYTGDDIVTVLQSACEYLGFPTRYVQLATQVPGEKVTHAIMEVVIGNIMYLFDPVRRCGYVKRGYDQRWIVSFPPLVETEDLSPWEMICAGRDSWGCGLVDADAHDRLIQGVYSANGQVMPSDIPYGASAVEPGPLVAELVTRFQREAGKENIACVDDLGSIVNVMYDHEHKFPWRVRLRRIPPIDDPAENAIRCRRSAERILADRYLYAGRSCGDVTTVVQAVCAALGVRTRYAEIATGYEGGYPAHAVMEIYLNRQAYICDIARSNPLVPGRLELYKVLSFVGDQLSPWMIMRIGADRWLAGMTGVESFREVSEEYQRRLATI